MANAKLDISGLLELNRGIQALPGELQQVGQGIIADEAKGMAFDARQGYRATFETHSGELGGNVTAQQQAPLVWRVFNAWGKAHWFEYVPGTALRNNRRRRLTTKKTRSDRKVRFRDFNANRGQIRVSEGSGQVGGFSGTKATPTQKSTAVFHPIFIPLAIRHRAQMVERFKDLLRKAGAVVSGDA